MISDIQKPFVTLISEYRSAFKSTCYRATGQEKLKPSVPDEAGVYVIYLQSQLDRPIYIGKAGHITKNGAPGGRTIRVRMFGPSTYTPYQFLEEGFCFGLKNKEQHQEAAHYNFQYPIKDLEVEVFQTSARISPTVIEHTLMQAFLNQFGVLPEANNEL